MFRRIARKTVDLFIEKVIETRVVARLLGLILNLKADKTRSDSELLDVAMKTFRKFPFNRYKIAPQQLKGEILGLLSIVRKLAPKTILEIGTSRGGTLFLFSRVAGPGTLIISIDWPPKGTAMDFPAWKLPFYRTFARPSQRLIFLRTDSHDVSTLEEAKRILNGHPIDFAFIDGDHTYEAVKQDFEMYSPLVRPGGVIALHDIYVHNRLMPTTKVKKFWDEIKDGYNFLELIENKKQHWYGMGIIYK